MTALAADTQGNLYGTTAWGGSKATQCIRIGVGGCGTVFKLAPNGTGGFSWTQIYQFQGPPNDGSVPQGALIADAAGNLYGTTADGGTYNAGTVYELSPAAGGGWTEKVLYNFTGGDDGRNPVGALVFDAGGNLYGATETGGPLQYGVVFELSPNGSGWTESVLHTFYSSPGGADGYYPSGPLLIDAAGNVYGAAYSGGTPADGVIFELSPGAGGGWTETVLYNFTGGSDGYGPGNLIFDSSGQIYGTAQFAGGPGYQGTVFKLTNSQGTWTEETLYAFNYDGGDGGRPMGVVVDAAGNLYGTAFQGGGSQDWGIVYRLTQRANGTWVEHVLHTFTGGTDGGGPAPIIFGPNGDLFGVTTFGGAVSGYDGFGVVFEIHPS
jgi:uncharacterized repeat protein (TIGR03803 family)